MYIPPETVETIIEMYRNGYTQIEISKTTGASLSQVKTRLKRRGVYRDGRIEVDKQEVISLYESGKSAYDIAKQIGSNASYIGRVLRENVPNYVSQREHQKAHMEGIDWDAAIAAYHNGALRADLAKHLGISLSKLGCEFRRRKVPVVTNRKVRRRQKGLTFELPISEIVRMRAKGLSFKRIGQLLKCSGDGARSAWFRWNNNRLLTSSESQ